MKNTKRYGKYKYKEYKLYYSMNIYICWSIQPTNSGITTIILSNN